MPSAPSSAAAGGPMAERRRFRDEEEEAAPVLSRPIQFRGGGFDLRPPGVTAVVVVFVLLALWETVSRLDWVDPKMLPSPLAVLGTLFDLLMNAGFMKQIGASLRRLAIGWVIGTFVGLFLGLAIGMWRSSRAIGLPVVSALFPIPAIGLLPLMTQWLGVGDLAIAVTIALGAALPTALAVYEGMEAVPRNLIRMGQSFGLPRRMILWKIVLPGARPEILSGLRNAAAIALILLVAAEMIATDRGVGSFILAAGDLKTIDQLLAGLVVLLVLGVAIGFVLSMLERWLLRWR